MTIMEGSFTQGGLAYFSESDAAKGPLEAGLNAGRGGFYGWMGLGGSVFCSIMASRASISCCALCSALCAESNRSF